MTNPKRLYETERKRQQRARLASGQVHKVVVYLTDEEVGFLEYLATYRKTDAPDALRRAIWVDYFLRVPHPRQTPPTQR